MERVELIRQLRHALALAENPNENQFEFDIMGTTFEFIDEGKV